MRRRTLSVFRARIGVSGFTVFHGFREVFYTFSHMRVFPCRLRMFERFIRMLNTCIGMAFFPMRRGALCVFEGLSRMFIASKRHLSQHRHADKRSYRSHYQRTSTHHGRHRCLLQG
jgi:hypothetical protein